MSQIVHEIKSARVTFNQRKPFYFVPTPKWIRTKFGGEMIADSKRAKLLYHHGSIVTYYFPKEDIRMDFLERSGKTETERSIGEKTYYNLKNGHHTAENAAWSFENLKEDAGEMKDHFGFDWDVMDAWFEESEEVITHPHDPYHLLDVRHSSREIRIEVNGKVIAESNRPVAMFETGLTVQYYLPALDVRREFLVDSGTITYCGYKGKAYYYNYKDGDKEIEDIAWYYPFPHPQYPEIQHLISFYPNKVDAFYLDGEKITE